MGCAAGIVGFYIVSAVVVSEWTFQWPYGPNRSCQCTEIGPRENGEYDGRQRFDTEVECLRGFARSRFEFCEYEGEAITLNSCTFAAGNLPGDSHGWNSECQSKCIELVAGDFVRDQEAFFEKCTFDVSVNIPIDIAFGQDDEQDDCDSTDFTIAVLPDSCYSNYVWGFSNYDPSNAAHVSKTKYFQDVPSHVSCQTLCQETDDCAFFSWRAYPDLEARENGMQNPMNSCILYNQDFMNEITAFVVQDSFPSDLCDMEQAAVCKTLPWEDNKFSLFSDYPCQTCNCYARCSWESPVHITGPAYCEQDVRETCTFRRPTFTYTLPPCEPGDERSTAPEEGTAETDTALYTEPARVVVDAEITHIIFSQGGLSANEFEGTAETDFALPTETTIEMTTVELSSESTIELRHL